MKTIKEFLFTSLTVMLLTACIHEIPTVDGTGNGGGNPPPTGGTEVVCSKDSVYYVNEVQPILLSGCAMTGCHDVASHEGDISLVTYANVMKIVKAGNANGSKLINVMIRTDGERMPPPPLAAIPAEQIEKIKTWINQGAKNNSCNGCDASKYNFAATIKPMIANKCQGCHNPTNLGGGIDLSTYDGIKAAAVSGTLYGSISWASGFSQMPKNSAKMSDCEIKQVKSWIDAGMNNN
jgi:Planctomycete cytochrome C